ncbi:MAG: hypothetical protein U0Z26_18580 [Anaerolineales bacterium]
MKLYYPRRNEMEIFKAPDEIKLNITEFNRKVITEEFNKVVCAYLVKRASDPQSRQKTLNQSNDAHADLLGIC